MERHRRLMMRTPKTRRLSFSSSFSRQQQIQRPFSRRFRGRSGSSKEEPQHLVVFVVLYKAGKFWRMRTKTLLIYINKTSKIKANKEYSLSLLSITWTFSSPCCTYRPRRETRSRTLGITNTAPRCRKSRSPLTFSGRIWTSFRRLLSRGRGVLRIGSVSPRLGHCLPFSSSSRCSVCYAKRASALWCRKEWESRARQTPRLY